MRGSEALPVPTVGLEVDEKPHEECGVVALLSFTEDVRSMCYTAGLTVQNRGEHAAGLTE